MPLRIPDDLQPAIEKERDALVAAFPELHDQIDAFRTECEGKLGGEYENFRQVVLLCPQIDEAHLVKTAPQTELLYHAIRGARRRLLEEALRLLKGGMAVEKVGTPKLPTEELFHTVEDALKKADEELTRICGEPVALAEGGATKILRRMYPQRITRIEELETLRYMLNGCAYVIDHDLPVAPEKRAACSTAFHASLDDALHRVCAPLIRSGGTLLPERIVGVLPPPLHPENPVRMTREEVGKHMEKFLDGLKEELLGKFKGVGSRTSHHAQTRAKIGKSAAFVKQSLSAFLRDQCPESLQGPAPLMGITHFLLLSLKVNLQWLQQFPETRDLPNTVYYGPIQRMNMLINNCGFDPFTPYTKDGKALELSASMTQALLKSSPHGMEDPRGVEPVRCLAERIGDAIQENGPLRNWSSILQLDQHIDALLEEESRRPDTFVREESGARQLLQHAWQRTFLTISEQVELPREQLCTKEAMRSLFDLSFSPLFGTITYLRQNPSDSIGESDRTELIAAASAFEEAAKADIQRLPASFQHWEPVASFLCHLEQSGEALLQTCRKIGSPAGEVAQCFQQGCRSLPLSVATFFSLANTPAEYHEETPGEQDTAASRSPEPVEKKVASSQPPEHVETTIEETATLTRDEFNQITVEVIQELKLDSGTETNFASLEEKKQFLLALKKLNDARVHIVDQKLKSRMSRADILSLYEAENAANDAFEADVQELAKKYPEIADRHHRVGQGNEICKARMFALLEERERQIERRQTLGEGEKHISSRTIAKKHMLDICFRKKTASEEPPQFYAKKEDAESYNETVRRYDDHIAALLRALPDNVTQQQLEQFLIDSDSAFETLAREIEPFCARYPEMRDWVQKCRERREGEKQQMRASCIVQAKGPKKVTLSREVVNQVGKEITDECKKKGMPIALKSIQEEELYELATRDFNDKYQQVFDALPAELDREHLKALEQKTTKLVQELEAQLKDLSKKYPAVANLCDINRRIITMRTQRLNALLTQREEQTRLESADTEPRALSRQEVLQLLLATERRANERALTIVSLKKGNGFEDQLIEAVQRLCPETVQHASDLDQLTCWFIGRLHAMYAVVPKALPWHERVRELNIEEYGRTLRELHRRISGAPGPDNLLSAFPEKQGPQEHAIGRETALGRARSTLREAQPVLLAPFRGNRAGCKVLETYFARLSAQLDAFIRRNCTKELHSTYPLIGISAFAMECIYSSHLWFEAAKIDSKTGLVKFREKLNAWLQIMLEDLLQPEKPATERKRPPVEGAPEERWYLPACLPAEQSSEEVPPRESPEQFWTSYISKIVEYKMRAFADACATVEPLFKKSWLAQARESALACAAEIEARMKLTAATVCAEAGSMPPDADTLGRALSEAALSVEGLLPSIPEPLREKFETIVMWEISDLFREQRDLAFWQKAPWEFWHPSTPLTLHVEQAFDRIVQPEESVEQKWERVKRSVANAYINALTEKLQGTVEERRSGATGTPCALSSDEFSWEWMADIQRTLLTLISAHMGAAPASDVDGHLSKMFSGARKQVLLARAASAVEKTLLENGVPQEICTLLRGTDTDLVQACVADAPPPDLRTQRQRFVQIRSAWELLPGERELLTRFCGIALIPGKSLSQQLKDQQNALQELARRCNDAYHAGEPCRTAATLERFLMPIAEEALKIVSTVSAPGVETESRILPSHIQELLAVIDENQQWIDTLPMGERSRKAAGYLERVFYWHEESGDFASRYRVVGDAAGDCTDARWKVDAVATIRRSGVIAVAPNKAGKSVLTIESAKLRSIFSALEDQQRAILGAKGGIVSSPAIEQPLQRLIAVGKEMQDLQVSLAALPDSTESMTKLEEELGKRAGLEQFLRSKEDVMTGLPGRAGVLLAHLVGLGHMIEKAQQDLEKTIARAEGQEQATIQLLSDAKGEQVLTELSLRLSREQGQTQALHSQLLRHAFPKTKEELEKCAQELRDLAGALVEPELLNHTAPPALPNASDTALLEEQVIETLEEARILISDLEDILLHRDELTALEESAGATVDRETLARTLKKESKQRRQIELRMQELRDTLARIQNAFGGTSS